RLHRGAEVVVEIGERAAAAALPTRHPAQGAIEAARDDARPVMVAQSTEDVGAIERGDITEELRAIKISGISARELNRIIGELIVALELALARGGAQPHAEDGEARPPGAGA